jgi:hypothetical protein
MPAQDSTREEDFGEGESRAWFLAVGRGSRRSRICARIVTVRSSR